MSRSKKDRGRWPGLCRTLLAATALLALPRAAEAGLTLLNSSGFVFYALENTTSTNPTPGPGFGQTSSIPLFANGGGLITPGGGFPFIGNPAGGTQSMSGPLNPPLDVVAAVPPLPPKFGSAETEIFAQGLGSQGGSLTQGGVFFDNKTFLADALSPTDVNLASLTFASATATFVNSGPGNLTITPASLMSVQGSIGATAGSYVAASLLTQITLPGSSNPIMLAPIVLAANQSNLNVNLRGNAPKDASAVNLVGGNLFATATSSLSSSITLAMGQTITVQSQLTLLADPGSFIRLVSDLVPLAGGASFVIPDFGAQAGGPIPTAIVPEPSAIALVGIGLATVGAWRARGARGARRLARS